MFIYRGSVALSHFHGNTLRTFSSTLITDVRGCSALYLSAGAKCERSTTSWEIFNDVSYVEYVRIHIRAKKEIKPAVVYVVKKVGFQ